ncbi:GlxA family transcriptional regulator [Pseudomonas asplenii]|uniref:GlxA family transcriptional regulator n=1 Tax=Pseudomonas asplenii TaxID=53407 RepID=UPI0004776258|nr:GlxA family transcriptional regulator [Pseudomonas fuscovaginae]
MVDRRVFSGGLQVKNYRYLQKKDESSPAGQAGVGFILMEHFSMPAFTQALDTLVTANLLQPSLFATRTVTLNGQDVVSDLGIVIRPDTDLASCSPDDFDLLVVCGGLRTLLHEQPELRAFLKKAAQKGVALGGLWNGAWFLGQANLLDGYRCAIHPEHRPALAEASRESQVTCESYMVDRDRYTAASPTGAFYMVLEWIGKMHNGALVDGIIDILAFEASRYRRVNPTLQVKMAEPLREVVKLMESNLEEPLDLRQLSSYVNRSRRQIERLFKEQLDTTPRRYYLELRVTEGRRLLQHSGLTIVQVAVACGFVSPSHFSKCYTAYFGYPPSREKRFE